MIPRTWCRAFGLNPVRGSSHCSGSTGSSLRLDIPLVLTTHEVVHSYDGTFQVLPHDIFRIRVHSASNVFLQSIVHGVELVEDSVNPQVRLVLVGIDGQSLLNALEDLVLDVDRIVSRNGNRCHFAFALPQSSNRLLADRGFPCRRRTFRRNR